jgi:hypothetical protein
MKCWKRVNAMIVRTLPLNLRSARADGSLLSRRGDARRAAGQCLVALALSAALAACGAEQSSNPLPADDPLAETAGQPAIRAADCSATGTVANLPANDDILAVRTGPGTNYREVARLGAGVEMHLCTPAKDNRWVGVIYRPGGELPDAERCRLTTDDSPRYEGPCRSGWVSARYVAREGAELQAGDTGDVAQVASVDIAEPVPPRATSFYFCEATEGVIYVRRTREYLWRSFFITNIFEAPIGETQALEPRYMAYLETNEPHAERVRRPICHEFANRDEATEIFQKYQSDYDANPKFEVYVHYSFKG